MLQLPAGQPAWDIYLLFNRDDAWKADVPAPDYWMAQLSGISSERRGDGNKFADETSKLFRNKQRIAMKKTITPSPLIVKIAIEITFLNKLVIFFVWPGVLLRLCF